MEQAIQLYAIDHVAVTVLNFQKSADWYKNLFGFEIIQKWDNAWLVGRGNIKIGLFVFPEATALDDPDSKIIIRKIAFSIDGNLFSQAVEITKAKGIQIIGPDDTGIAYRFQFRDPDGHLLEVTTFHGVGGEDSSHP